MKKKDKRNIKDAETTLCYQLWGEDRFSYEDYFCDVYSHRSSAYRAKRKKELANKNSANGIKDHYWIVPMTWADHFRWVDERNAQRDKTSAEINRHEAIIDNIMPDFLAFLPKSLSTPGKHVYALPVEEDCYIKCLRVDIFRYEQDSDVYDLKVGIHFKNDWHAAGLVSSSLYIKSGTMEELQQTKETDACFKNLKEHFHEAIKKYFYGD